MPSINMRLILEKVCSLLFAYDKKKRAWGADAEKSSNKINCSPLMNYAPGAIFNLGERNLSLYSAAADEIISAKSLKK